MPTSQTVAAAVAIDCSSMHVMLASSHASQEANLTIFGFITKQIQRLQQVSFALAELLMCVVCFLSSHIHHTSITTTNVSTGHCQSLSRHFVPHSHAPLSACVSDNCSNSEQSTTSNMESKSPWINHDIAIDGNFTITVYWWHHATSTQLAGMCLAKLQ